MANMAQSQDDTTKRPRHAPQSASTGPLAVIVLIFAASAYWFFQLYLSGQITLPSISQLKTPLDPPKVQPNTASQPAIMAYTLPPLGYAYDALEPHFDAETMEIHHSRHHQTYVNNLNAAIASQQDLSALAVEDLIAKIESAPESTRKAIRNQGGGHANHSFFWKGLKIGTKLGAESKLRKAVETDFGSFEAFQAEFEKAATSVFGSGWAWLVLDGGKLRVVTTKDQDSPLMGKAVSGAEGKPVLALDVWEHAYYLKYRNKRPDYIKAFWSVVDWERAEEVYAEVGSAKL